MLSGYLAQTTVVDGPTVTAVPLLAPGVTGVGLGCRF